MQEALIGPLIECRGDAVVARQWASRGLWLGLLGALAGLGVAAVLGCLATGAGGTTLASGGGAGELATRALAVGLWTWPLEGAAGAGGGAAAHAVAAMLLLGPASLLPALPAGLAVLAVGKQHRRRLLRDLQSTAGVNGTSAAPLARRHANLGHSVCAIREWLAAGGGWSAGLAADLIAAGSATLLLLSGRDKVGVGAHPPPPAPPRRSRTQRQRSARTCSAEKPNAAFRAVQGGLWWPGWC